MKYILGKSGQLSNKMNVITDTKEVSETEFYNELEKAIIDLCPKNQIDKSLETAKQYLNTGKSVTIEGNYFIIKKK